MNKLLFTIGAFTSFAIGMPAGAAIATANADAPRCLFQGDWNCQGAPPYHGPQMPTWNTPGTYGGWTNNPILCDPISYQCRQMVPGR